MERPRSPLPRTLAGLLRPHGAEIALLAAFVATRAVARAVFGLRFDGEIFGYWQVLDAVWLRDDLLRSVVFLHAQPPLFNLGLGLGLKTFGDACAPVAFEGAFLILGYLGLLGMYRLLLELGTPSRAALVVALVQTLSTTWLVYESWLFYTLPTAVLTTWAAVWICQASRRGAAAAAFGATVVALSWLRATYHPLWALVSLALLWLLVRSAPAPVRRFVPRVSLVALALVLALPAKNWLLVGSFSSSSWLGLSLARMTTDRLGEPERERWIQAGLLDPVARVRPFSPLSAYPIARQEVPPTTPEHPALRSPSKSDGSPNFNHAAYVDIARRYQAGAFQVLWRSPGLYLDRVRRAVVTWLRPPTDYIMVVPQREALRTWDRLHSRFALGSSLERRRAGPTLVLVPAAVLLLVALSWPCLARSRRLEMVAFPLLTIGWNLVVGSLAEVEENNRFRVEVEGLMVVLGHWAAIDLFVRLWRRGRSLPAGGDR